jgi:hypothetical protein
MNRQQRVSVTSLACVYTNLIITPAVLEEGPDYDRRPGSADLVGAGRPAQPGEFQRLFLVERTSR